jgi:hypothetical protein
VQKSFRVLVFILILFVLGGKGVTQVQGILESLVLGFFNLDLFLKDQPEKFELSIKALRLSFVSIDEVSSMEVDTRPASHQVSNDLHQSLLLKGITHVFVALHIALN